MLFGSLGYGTYRNDVPAGRSHTRLPGEHDYGVLVVCSVKTPSNRRFSTS